MTTLTEKSAPWELSQIVDLVHVKRQPAFAEDALRRLFLLQ
jgi:hypothetical protein